MKYYIASKLENAAIVKKVASVLTEAGLTHTYDWTAQRSTRHSGPEVIAEIALKECAGVLDADIVVVILPGGRGTHVELGIALGSNKQIYLCAEDSSYFISDDRTCAFYWHKNVKRVVGPIDAWFSEIFPLPLLS